MEYRTTWGVCLDSRPPSTTRGAGSDEQIPPAEPPGQYPQTVRLVVSLAARRGFGEIDLWAWLLAESTGSLRFARSIGRQKSFRLDQASKVRATFHYRFFSGINNPSPPKTVTGWRHKRLGGALWATHASGEELRAGSFTPGAGGWPLLLYYAGVQRNDRLAPQHGH